MMARVGDAVAGAGTGYLSLHLLGRRVAVAGASERSVREALFVSRQLL